MSKTAPNIFIPSNYSVWTAPLGTTPPTLAEFLDGTNPFYESAPFYEMGYLSDQGVTEGHDINETDIYDLVGQLVAVARNQEKRPFTFEALEDNRIVRELRYPFSTFSSSGGTSTVQTVTISGTPTGGTFDLGPASGNAYNATTAALATALNTAFDVTGITVTGTPGSSYVVTFPASMGAVAQMSATGHFTGGTTPSISVALTTPGTAPQNTRAVGSGTGQNLRVFLVYVAKGGKHKLFVIKNGEATQAGTVGYTGNGAAVSQFTLQPFADADGDFFQLLDDDPAQNESYS